MIGLIAGLCAFAIPAAAASAQEPWPCDNVSYITQFDGANTDGDTLFLRADVLADGTVDLVELGRHQDINLNAIGFRAQDGFMYAFDRTNQEIVRISQDASGAPVFTSIGFPTGATVTDTVTAAILADGTYMMVTAPNASIIDVSGPTATLVQNLTGTVGEMPGGDFAQNPVDGELYGVAIDPSGTSRGLYRFEVVGTTLVRQERVSDTIGGGAQWFTSDGLFYSYLNGPTPQFPDEVAGVYRTNLETGEVTQLATGPNLAQVDGASCANTLALKKDANPRTVTQGDTLTYTYTLTSRGLFENDVDFVDTLPAGMRYVPGSVDVSPSFGSTNDYGNSRDLEISGTMDPGMEVTITARVRVGFNTDCDSDAVLNQAEATTSTPGLPPVTIVSDDPTTEDEVDDPTAVQVECAGPPRLVLKKKTPKGTVRPGEVVPYKITVRNNGGSAAKRVKVCDKLPSGLELLKARGAKTSNRKACWTLKRLGAGKKKTLKVLAQVKTSAGSGSLTNRATAKGKNTKRTKAKEKVEVETGQDPCGLGRIAARC